MGEWRNKPLGMLGEHEKSLQITTFENTEKARFIVIYINEANEET